MTAPVNAPFAVVLDCKLYEKKPNLVRILLMTNRRASSEVNVVLDEINENNKWLGKKILDRIDVRRGLDHTCSCCCSFCCSICCSRCKAAA